MRAQDEAVYREGVVLNKPPREGRGSFVNVGLTKVGGLQDLVPNLPTVKDV